MSELHCIEKPIVRFSAIVKCCVSYSAGVSQGDARARVVIAEILPGYFMIMACAALRDAGDYICTPPLFSCKVDHLYSLQISESVRTVDLMRDTVSLETLAYVRAVIDLLRTEMKPPTVSEMRDDVDPDLLGSLGKGPQEHSRAHDATVRRAFENARESGDGKGVERTRTRETGG
ncbi:hypothetical protein FKP32DRAFT_1600311 [Trametes sanguinea]|nr:hypothetical protein FKP32DRAFT_1600311 [Trametes sanguinea]